MSAEIQMHIYRFSKFYLTP